MNEPKKAAERATHTVPEAAKILGISRASAYAAAKSGQLVTVRFGKRVLVPKFALQRMLDGAGASAGGTKERNS